MKVLVVSDASLETGRKPIQKNFFWLLFLIFVAKESKSHKNNFRKVPKL